MKHEKEFLFISGCDRSGTTALVRLLNSHKDICLGMERYKGLIKRDKLNSLNHSRFEKDNFFNIMDEETNIQWDYFYEPLMEKFDSCKYVGDKVPRYFEIYNHLSTEFPKAKHIFIVRDPYEVASSWKVRAQDKNDINWLATNDVHRSVAIWNKSLEIAYKQLKLGKMDIVIVSYNEIFSGNKKELTKITDHIGTTISDDLNAKFEEMTKSWSQRSTKKLALTDEEVLFVSNNANIKLAKFIIDSF